MCADVVEIPLRRRDGTVRAIALVDVTDETLATAYRWHLSGHGYVERNLPGQRGAKTSLHRAVAGLQPGDPREVDHRNGDPLDCRRSNLRIVAGAHNRQNLGKRAGTSSRYRGVSWYRATERWQAYAAGPDRRRRHLGYFVDEDVAGATAAAFRSEHMMFVNEARSVAPTPKEA